MEPRALENKYAGLWPTMDVAAPVDPQYMFRDGLVERTELRGPRCELTGKQGIVVDGSVDVDVLVVRAHALFVTGDVRAKTIEIYGTMVVLGALEATEVHGWDEPNTLTVMGKTTVGSAIADRQFIFQFLGGGTIDLLVDTEGAAEEILGILHDAGSKLRVKRTSDEAP